ncbi:MAG: FAD-dependent oxidoreductase [Synechococcaceae cyanobacterium SM2_3_1]|nr:FAD-dependent oxidoreductase [Synechococcaceae cyanobacterium SM2_3_1]
MHSQRNSGLTNSGVSWYHRGWSHACSEPAHAGVFQPLPWDWDACNYIFCSFVDIIAERVLLSVSAAQVNAMHDVIVVGAGIAGLTCARQLHRAGLDVLVLEKSAGLGGRMATRRVVPQPGDPAILVDHGAQYITADTDSLYRFIRELLSLGLLVEWTRSLHKLTATGLELGDVDDQHPHYICPQGMTALARYLGESLHIDTQIQVTRVMFHHNGWRLSTEDERMYEAAHLVLALPAPQILQLLQGVLVETSPLVSTLESALYNPCMTVLAGYDFETPVPEWKGIKGIDDPYLDWIGVDSSKRPPPHPLVLVLHANALWSTTQLHVEAQQLDQAGRQLLTYAAQRLEPWIAEPVWMQVHRWRYALPSEIVGLASVATRFTAEHSPDPQHLLICAGDWCGGGKVEGAWISGHDAATQLLTQLGIASVPSPFHTSAV